MNQSFTAVSFSTFDPNRYMSQGLHYRVLLLVLPRLSMSYAISTIAVSTTIPFTSTFPGRLSSEAFKVYSLSAPQGPTVKITGYPNGHGSYRRTLVAAITESHIESYVHPFPKGPSTQLEGIYTQTVVTIPNMETINTL